MRLIKTIDNLNVNFLQSLAEAMMMEAESAVMANFDFLSGGMDVDDDDDMGDDLDDVDDEPIGKQQGKRKGRVSRHANKINVIGLFIQPYFFTFCRDLEMRLTLKQKKF